MQFQRRLQIITAIRAETMIIRMHKGDLHSESSMELSQDDSVILGSLPIDNGMRLHVDGELVCDILDGSVEKFDLSEDHYERMDNTLRNFLKKNQLGKYNNEEQEKLEKRRLERKEMELECAETCTPGSRCQVIEVY